MYFLLEDDRGLEGDNTAEQPENVSEDPRIHREAYDREMGYRAVALGQPDYTIEFGGALYLSRQMLLNCSR
jgi:hypothetical protein